MGSPLLRYSVVIDLGFVCVTVYATVHRLGSRQQNRQCHQNSLDNLLFGQNDPSISFVLWREYIVEMGWDTVNNLRTSYFLALTNSIVMLQCFNCYYNELTSIPRSPAYLAMDVCTSPPGASPSFTARIATF